MANLKTEVILTMNGKAVINVLELMKQKAAETKAEMDRVGKDSELYKPLKEQYDAFSSAHESIIKSTERLQHAVQNLSTTSLQDLRRALGAGKRDLQKLSEAQLAEADSIREMMRLVGNQIRLLEGQYVKISKGLADLSSQSDQWLSKAIAQQKELLEVTRRGTKEYMEQEGVMRQLTAENDRRTAAVRAEAAARQQAQLRTQVAESRRMLSSEDSMRGYSQNELRSAINTLAQARDAAKLGGEEWKTYAAEVEAAEKRLASLSGKVKEVKAAMSAGEANAVIAKMDEHTETEIREAINALRQLQNQVNVGGTEWKAYANDIDAAESRLAKLTGRVKEVKAAMSKQEADNVISNMGEHTEAEVREAIAALRQLQNQVNMGSREWMAYSADIEAAENKLGLLTGRIKDVKTEMSQDTVESRMANLGAQSENSLKEMLSYLEKMKGKLDPFTDEWERLARQIDEVKQRMDEVQSRSPYVRNTNAAFAVAYQNQLEFRNGATHDVTQKDLAWAKGHLQKELVDTPMLDVQRISDIQAAIDKIDERMNMFRTDTKEAATATVNLERVLGNLKTASLEELEAASSALNSQLKKLAPSSDEAKKIKKQLRDIDKEIRQVGADMVDVNDVLARSKRGKASIDELRKAYKQLEEELNELNTKSTQFAEKQRRMKELKKYIDDATGAVQKQGNAWSTALRNLTAYVGLFAVFNQLKSVIVSAIKKNFEYSSSLTDIRKVSGLTTEQVKKLSVELSKIETRTNIDTLAQLAYEGSKLGMGKYGVEGLTQFVKAADKINVAIGEEMGEQALPAMAKMVETMGLIPKLGIERAMLATGSAMFKLASTSTATASNITEFAKRLTGVSRTAGITTDQLLALGSASDTLFLMPEVSATAMSKFIVSLQKNHNLIEKDLNIEEGTIKKLYAAGKAMDAVVLVLERMRDKGNMNALGGIFKDLGSDGQRLITAMVTMSKNVDVLKDHLYESKEAFRKASAVSAEYAMQQESAAGILERANNLWSKAFVNPDGVDSVKAMAQGWYDMSKILTEGPIMKGTLHMALQAVILSVKILVALLPLLINFAVARGLLGIVKAFVDLGRVIKVAIVAQRGLNAAMKANVFGAIASIILTAVGVVYAYANAAKEAAKAEAEAQRKANEWKKTINEAQLETAKMRKKLQSYKVALEQANLSQETRNTQIARFNRDFRQYISKLGIEIKSVDDLRKNYKALSEEIQMATYYRMREKAKEEALPKLREDRLGAANRVETALSKIYGLPSGFTTESIMEMFERGSNAMDIYQSIIKGSLGDDRVHVEFNGKNEKYKYTIGRNPHVIESEGNQELLSSLRHYANATVRVRKKEKEIDEYYSKFVPKDYTPWVEDKPGTLENDAPNKEAITKARAEAQERRRAWSEELKQKQDEANAIMDNVRNFYDRQINAKLSGAINLGMDETEQSMYVEPVKRRMNEALEQVRLAIAGQKNTWEDFKLTMQQDLVEQTDSTGVNLSEKLLSDITENNIDALRKKLSELGDNLSRPLNSILSEVFAKATRNAQSNLKLELQQKEMRRKAAQEHDYTGIVQQNMYDTFNKMGYAAPTEIELQSNPQGKAAFGKRRDNIISMFENARQNISQVFSYDMSSTDDRGLLMKLLFGNDIDGFGKRVSGVLGTSEEEWQTFYLKLIQYNNEYELAQKKEDDERDKLNTYRWQKTDEYKEFQEKLPGMEQYTDIMGSYRNSAQRMGMKSVSATDPELALMQARLDFAKQYYKFLEAHEATDNQKAEARRQIMESQAAYAKKLTADMFEQYNALMGFMNPLQTFGESVGDAFATMTENASEGRKALRNALKQMIKSFATNTLQMINQQQIDRAQTTAHYTQLLLMQQTFGTAQLTGETAIGTAKTNIKRNLDISEEQQEAQHQKVLAALRSAGIFGWCVSTLGPIAGPIAYSAMMAILMGLINFAVGKIGGNSTNVENAKATNQKVVSGMLTYDSGNVQDLRPYVSDSGELFWAKPDDGKPHEGVNLLTMPTATTINGQPALVAENGPELVIGRETTQAMMMNNPALLKALVAFDRNHSGRHAYDAGNVSQAAVDSTTTDAVVSNNTATNVALLQAVNALLQRLDQPIEAKIDMYGRGKLYDSITRANQFMKNK